MNKQRAEQKRRADELLQNRSRLNCISSALTQAYCTFNSVSDPVIMDSCIFEINALSARRDSILRDMRRSEQSSPSNTTVL